MSSDLRSSLIRLAAAQPELRPYLLPMLTTKTPSPAPNGTPKTSSPVTHEAVVAELEETSNTLNLLTRRLESLARSAPRNGAAEESLGRVIRALDAAAGEAAEMRNRVESGDYSGPW
mgnify:FL=1